MIVISALCAVLAVITSFYALYQSEKYNNESRNLNRDTRNMIISNEKSISNLHVTLREVLAKESVKINTDGISVIKMRSYDSVFQNEVKNEFNKLGKIITMDDMFKLTQWLSSDDVAMEITVNKELSGEDYKDIEQILSKIRHYGIWITVSINSCKYDNEIKNIA